MFSSPSHLVRPGRRLTRAAWSSAVALTLLTAGCASVVTPPSHDVPTSREAPLAATCPQLCLPVSPVRATTPLAGEAIVQLLDYASQTRRMPSAELSQEVTRLSDAAGASRQMQLALVLSQFRQLPELVRAQDLLAQVLADTSAEARALHPLASLLAARYAEQRRLEEQLEKQAQQMRDVQRRLDQTNDRLEALKAIERSLTNRNSPAPASNSRSNRTPAP